jgi:hypothetical protein
MEKEKNELEELTREITRVIADNKKFLDRVMDDDFEPELEEEEDGEE